MRTLLLGSALLLGLSAPAFAAPVSTRVADNEIIPVVVPGEQIGIACDALEVAQSDSDVRVVLTISAAPGDSSTTGYKKVLATDQQVSKGAVRVKVPNTPDIANHTYDMSVYVVDPKGSQSCDAGSVKVTQTLSMLEQPGNGQHS
jgi:hypothetical protein